MIPTRAQQNALHDRCFHPSGVWTEISKAEIEQSATRRFERMVELHGERPALIDTEQELTYDQANRLANRIAHRLLALRGSAPEPVAFLLPEGAWQAVAAYGIQKAGKFYVSLDASHPQTRLRHILDNAGTRLLLTTQTYLPLAEQLADTSLRVLLLEEITSNRADRSGDEENPGLPVAPDAIAFLNYTSGSTGRPKGAIRLHRQLMYEARSIGERAHLCAEDRVIGLGVNYVFGLTTLVGAAAIFFDTRQHGFAAFGRWAAETKATVIRGVTTSFRQFIHNLHIHNLHDDSTGHTDPRARSEQSRVLFPNVRLIMWAGEPLPGADILTCRPFFPVECIYVSALAMSELGPVAQYFIDPETVDPSTILPTGYPVEDREVLIVDEERRLLGFNQTGEIAVRTHLLGPGYWNQPEQTNARFLPNSSLPAQITPGAGTPASDSAPSIYLTGDMGWMAPDGCLHYAGRKDLQVKVQGYRVEIAEVEAALLALDGIREAAVAARSGAGGIQRLVAYLVATEDANGGANGEIDGETDAPVSIARIRRHLAEKLPAYMVPSHYMFLPALPMMPTGKVDRVALPEPPPVRPSLETPYIAPRTPLEETVADIWGEILCIEPVGIHDRFVDLGGNSLAAAQLLSHVYRRLRVQVPWRTLWETPTVADMAAAVLRGQIGQLDNLELDQILHEVMEATNTRHEQR